jgi:uncharacterized protein
METKHSYKIPFLGLKEGKHNFEFTISKEFFEQYEYDFVENVTLNASVELQKMSTMMIMDFSLDAQYITQCDQCGEDFDAICSSDNRLYVKFGEGESTDENILLLDQSEYEIDVAELLYEFFVTSVPAKHSHDEGDCNEEILEKLSKLRVQDTEEKSNPIWDKLKELKK